MNKEHTIIIGAGPCGLSCAIELENVNIKPLIIEKNNIVNTIYQFPTHQTFFSTAKNLEIGNLPFITATMKPVRNDALAYYREVAQRYNLRINTYETVIDVIKTGQDMIVKTKKIDGAVIEYKAKHVIIATGYYDQPNYMDVKGEQLSKVTHYFKEAHPYYKTNVAIIGGKNSAIDAALELSQVNAHITVLYRGETYSESIKPWILPTFQSLVNNGQVTMEFNAEVIEITEKHIIYDVDGKTKKIDNDFVFAMTGYKPHVPFLKKIGIKVDSESGRPNFDEHTFETNVSNVYVAGVIISGYNGNETFIENGRYHGVQIAKAIQAKSNN